MRLYELVIVFRASLSEDKRKNLIETIKSWLKNAKIAKENAWGEKTLAYKIKRESRGYYYSLSLEVGDVLPSDLEKRIQNQDNILRHLLLRKK